ncbi:MAG: hypothetical protein LC104_08060 [Bacteroidales bacterium]|nr:hypothetical protein [Bacteroidales bacterium]
MQSVRRSFLASFLSACVLGILAGCGSQSGPKLYPASGTVTFDGKPIETGRITFKGANANDRTYAADITNGEYKLELEAGQKIVEITASRLIPGKFDNSNGKPEPIGEMYIPKMYNENSQLKAEVKDSGENKFPFELKAK